jgi:hypothetical protein
MISPASTALSLAPLAQNAPEPHPYPSVQRRKRSLMAVFEIFKPSDHRAIDVFDDYLQALAVRPLGFSTNRTLQLSQTLPSRPSHPSLEMVAQKVKAALFFCVYNPRLYGMQGQAGLRRPSPHLLKGFFSFRLAPAQDHEASSGGEFHPSALTEPDVKLSPHPAPTNQPRVSRRVPTGQTAWGPAARCDPANAPTRALDIETACTSSAPKLRGPR